MRLLVRCDNKKSDRKNDDNYSVDTVEYLRTVEEGGDVSNLKVSKARSGGSSQILDVSTASLKPVPCEVLITVERDQSSGKTVPVDRLESQRNEEGLCEANYTEAEDSKPSVQLPANCKKRPRSPDSKPAAIPNMAGGARIRQRVDVQETRNDDPLWGESDSDDEPLENEPPGVDNHRCVVTVRSAGLNQEPRLTERDKRNDEEFAPSELSFRQILKKQRGLEIVEQDGDGNCLFRAVSLQVYGDASMHVEVRERCLDFMERDPQHFAPFVDGDFAMYISRKRRLGVHGNNPEIQAISELFNRPVEVFTPDRGSIPLNIFQTVYKTNDVPIRLSYHDGNHYNAVIDPLVPTAGLGLGMPGLQPGLADKLQLDKAVVESDQIADEMELKKALVASREDEMKRAVDESKALSNKYSSPVAALRGTAGLDFDLEQKALMNSLESYHRQEHGQKQKASPVVEHVSSVARLPDVSEGALSSFAAATPSVASIANDSPAVASRPLGSADEYPATVQELVMNGFELRKVVNAYELIGDNFDDLLAYLMSSS